MPKVSVLLPVYNDETNIITAINSVIKQTFSDWELIIIDDCSTDKTNELIKEHIKDIKYGIKLITNPVNIGTYMSLNNGLLIAQGKYISRVDSDDELDSTILFIQSSFLEENNNYMATNAKFIRDGHQAVFGEITMMYRKAIIDRIGYYDSVRFAADSEFTGRINEVYGGDIIYAMEKVLYYAKRRENSLTTSPITGCGTMLREKYVANYRKWHKSGKKLYMPYPLIYRYF